MTLFPSTAAHRIRAAIPVIAAWFLFPACAIVDGNDPSLDVRFSVAETRYDVFFDGNDPAVSFEIASTIENRGSAAIHLLGCQTPNRPQLQKNVAGIWTTVYSMFELECISPPFVLDKGDSYSDVLEVETPLDPEFSLGAKWESGIAVDGTYRLIRNVFGRGIPDGDGASVLLEERFRVSGTFEIRAFVE